MRSKTALLLAAVLPSLLAPPDTFAQGSIAEDVKDRAQRAIEPLTGKTDDRLKEVASFGSQVTGVTVSEDGRIFVNFPRWSEDVGISVAEVMPDGRIKAYPDADWNAWRNASPAMPPQNRFVCVQSLVADGRGSLWVLDPAAPNTEKVIENGPKLVQIDLKTNAVKRVYAMPSDIAGPASYLNDVRFAPDAKHAFITDSGQPGAIVVVDLESGKAWRALSNDPTTQAEKDAVVMADGKPLKRPDGRQPQFNADGIALSPDGKTLFWQALTGKTLYKLPTDALIAARDNPQAAQGKAEKVATTEPVDGLWADRNGTIYLSSIADNAVKVLKPDGTIQTVLTDARLRWPDTFAQGPDGTMYVTASHIMDSPWFHSTGWVSKDFRLFSFPPYQPSARAASR